MYSITVYSSVVLPIGKKPVVGALRRSRMLTRSTFVWTMMVLLMLTCSLFICRLSQLWLHRFVWQLLRMWVWRWIVRRTLSIRTAACIRSVRPRLRGCCRWWWRSCFCKWRHGRFGGSDDKLFAVRCRHAIHRCGQQTDGSWRQIDCIIRPTGADGLWAARKRSTRNK